MHIEERVLTAMDWGEPDRVPLTVYDWMLPRGLTERQLRASGVGLITRLPAHRVEHREGEITTREYWESGRPFTRRTIRTPGGEVWQKLEPDRAYGTSNWIHEHFIKTPEDMAAPSAARRGHCSFRGDEKLSLSAHFSTTAD